jgi:hypothetical protein
MCSLVQVSGPSYFVKTCGHLEQSALGIEHSGVRAECLLDGSARNGNSDVPVYFLKAKQGYTARKMGTDKWI